MSGQAEQLIIESLLEDAAVAALVDDRVHPMSVPQGTPLSAILVTRESGGPLYADDGEVGLVNVRLRIESYAVTYGEAKSVAEAVESLLSGHVGDGVPLIELEDERDEREGGANAESYVYRVSQIYSVWLNTEQ